MSELKTPLTSDTFDDVVNALAATELDGSHEVIIKRIDKTRTGRQNRALHLYFTMIAAKLNEAGIDQVALMQTFKHGFSLPNTKDSIKALFQRIAGILTGEDRTHRLSTTELTDVYNTFDRGMSEKTGVHVPFPSIEPPLLGDHNVDIPNSRERSTGRSSGSNGDHGADANNDVSAPGERSQGLHSDAVQGSGGQN